MSEERGIDTSTPSVRDGVKTDEGTQTNPAADAPAPDVPSEPRAGGAGEGDNLPASGLR